MNTVHQFGKTVVFWKGFLHGATSPSATPVRGRGPTRWEGLECAHVGPGTGSGRHTVCYPSDTQQDPRPKSVINRKGTTFSERGGRNPSLTKDNPPRTDDGVGVGRPVELAVERPDEGRTQGLVTEVSKLVIARANRKPAPDLKPWTRALVTRGCVIKHILVKIDGNRLFRPYFTPGNWS